MTKILHISPNNTPPHAGAARDNTRTKTSARPMLLLRKSAIAAGWALKPLGRPRRLANFSRLLSEMAAVRKRMQGGAL